MVNVRIHQWEKNPEIDGRLFVLHGVADFRQDARAYVLFDDPDETIWLCWPMAPIETAFVLSHEMLHVVLCRIGLQEASAMLDNLPRDDYDPLYGGIPGL